uniref:Uncharacterized protein n=1 Tax=Ananas comosus var. bracteatus TaxID=296719 RepID=A0A6V7QWD8_ANACO
MSEITAALMQKEWLKTVCERTVPLRTYGTSDPALTSLVRYLIHDSSDYVTGNIFIVDSGVTLPEYYTVTPNRLGETHASGGSCVAEGSVEKEECWDALAGRRRVGEDSGSFEASLNPEEIKGETSTGQWDKIGRSSRNRFQFNPKTNNMAEGTRLRDLSEHLATLEGKLQKLTTDYQGKVRELSNQILEVKDVGQKHYEDLQAEATKRHDMVLRDNTIRHEELLKLLSTHAPPSKSVNRDNEDPNELRFQNHKFVGGSSQGRVRENKGKGILPVPEMDAEFDNDGSNFVVLERIKKRDLLQAKLKNEFLGPSVERQEETLISEAVKS